MSMWLYQPSVKRLKNVLIFCLVLICLFLTSRLWFGGFSDQSLFLHWFGQDMGYNQLEAAEQMVQPYRIVTNTGTNRFSIRYNNIANSPEKEVAHKALSEMLKNGEFVKAQEPNWVVLLSRKSIVYDYAAPMPAEAFVQFFKQKSSRFTNRVKQFDQVVFLPEENDKNGLSIYFVDRVNHLMFQFRLESFQDNDLLLETMDAIRGSHQDFFYLSTSLSGFSSAENLFIAKWEQDSLPYERLYAEHSFGEISSPNVEKQIDIFFENPGTKNFQGADNGGIFTYNDEKTVVMYYPNNVLEYAYYANANTSEKGTFASSMMAALGFMKKDTSITNEYHLTHYEQKEDKWYFYFDYSVNNFPLYFSKTKLEEIKMKSAIEIVVEQNQVVRYRRYAISFRKNEITSLATKDFETAIENAAAIQGESVGGIGNATLEDFSLGYRVDAGEDLYLFWYIVMNDLVFMQSTQ